MSQGASEQESGRASAPVGTTGVMDRLRAETRACHVATEKSALSQAMVHGTITLEQYVALLEAFEGMHAALDQATARCRDPRVHAVVLPPDTKVPLLRADLESLAHVTVLRRGALHVAVRQYARCLAEVAGADDGATLLGHHYVFEGSMLGGQVLWPRLAQCLGLDARSLTYYRGYGAATFERWKAWSGRMKATLVAPADVDRAVNGAMGAFGHVAAVFNAVAQVMPATPDTRGSVATLRSSAPGGAAEGAGDRSSIGYR